jgi:8-oxo-dGTP pyrophosphatase MutT (NUDIX family)
MENNEDILEFGIKRDDEERRDGGCSVVFDPETQKYAVYKNLKNGTLGLFGGGFDSGENEQEGTLRELIEESGLIDYLHIEKIDRVITHYHNSNKNVNRVAFASCFLVILNSPKVQQTKLEEHEKFELEWHTNEEIFESWKSRNHNRDYDHWIHFLNKAVKRAQELGHDKTSVLDNLA